MNLFVIFVDGDFNALHEDKLKMLRLGPCRWEMEIKHESNASPFNFIPTHAGKPNHYIDCYCKAS